MEKTNNQNSKPIRGQKKAHVRTVSKDKQLVQSELALRESEQRYRSLAEASQDMIFIIGRTGQVEYVNSFAAQQFSRKAEEMVGAPISALFPEEIANRQAGNVRQIFEDAKPRYVEAPSFLGERTTWLGTWLVPLNDENGKVKSVMGVARDITDRKKAEAALQESESRYRLLVEQSLMGIGIARGNDLIFANPALLHMFGYQDFEEFRKNSFIDIIAPESRQAAAAQMKRIAEGKKPDREFDLAIIRKDGETRILQGTNIQLTLEGEIYNHFTFLDITERKQADQALQKSEQLFRALIEHSHDSITTISEDGTILYDSPTIIKVLGYSPTERVGTKVFEYVHPDERESMTKGFVKFVKIPGASMNYQAQFLHKDGRWRWIEAVRTNLLHNPMVAAVVVNYRDITERKQAEEILRESEEKFRIAFDNAPMGMSIILSNGQFLAVNPTLCQMVGYTREELLNGTLNRITHPDDIERGNLWIKKMISGDMSEPEFEKRYIHKDGHIIWGVVRARWIHNPDGLPRMSIVHIQDITARKKAEAELQASHEAERIFADRLTGLSETTTELSKMESLDMLCRRAVELGRERLDFDRISIWFTTPELTTIIGTYGVDTQGQITDERGNRYNINPQSNVYPILKSKIPLLHLKDVKLYLQGKAVGHGEHLMAGLWDGNTMIGYISVDNLLRQRPFTDSDQKILQLYASALGHMCTLLRAQEEIRAGNERFTKSFHSSPIATVVTIQPDGRLVDVNDTFLRITGYTREEVIGKTGLEMGLWADLEDHARFGAAMTSQQSMRDVEGRLLTKSGKKRLVLASTETIKIADQPHALVMFTDITERKQAEEALRQSEEDFRQLFEAESDAILLIDNQTGLILRTNSAACSLYGYTREELLAKKNTDLSAEGEKTRYVTQETQLSTDQIISIPLRYHKKKDGTVFPVEITGRFFMHQGRRVHIAAIRDITERQRADDEVKASRERLSSIFRVAPVGIGVVINRVFKEVNEHMLELIGYSREELLEQSARMVYPDEAEFQRVGREKYADIRTKGTGVVETRWKHKDGQILDILLSSTPLNPDDLLSGVLFTAQDITERKKAEAVLREREYWLRESQRVGRLGSYRFDIQGGSWQSTELLDDIFGIDATFPKTVAGWLEIIHPEQRQEMNNYLLQKVVTEKNTFNKEYRIVRINDRQERWVHGVGELAFNDAGEPTLMFGTIQDITERKQAEDALALQAEELRRRNEELARLYRASGSLLSGVTSNLPILAQTIVRVVQQEFGQSNCSLLTIQSDADEMTRLAVAGPYAHLVQDKRVKASGASPVAQAIRSGKVVNIGAANAFQENEPEWDAAQSELVIPLKIGDIVIGVIDIQSSEKNAFTADDERLMAIFAERAALTLEHGRLNAQIETRMKQLISMRTVDMAIASSFELDLILGILLDQLIGQLSIHAADVLVFDTNTQTFQFASERGFRTQVLHQSRLGLGESHAGRVAQERRIITIPNLQEQPGGFHKYPDLTSEQFIGYIGVPLIAKGQIKGVLEIFHREPLTLSRDEYSFLETLASQSAIAIDNSGLFENLQKSNADLTIAYDSTLEGWAKALELRDKETEGHTHRVTDMTSSLARSLNVSENEIMHIYRGALLHDIGKMGVPDSVVLKPGPLTPEEWEIMRRHPQYAFDLLSPIPFLKQSLDIPYCHHERWDGTGYPRKLKGNEIPLAARIFAVVDVWDALTSDRPYRSAWSGERAMEYIQQQSGSHFDPEVVKLFMNFSIPKITSG
jgi:PAS domain S-box-containing protein